MTVYVLSADGVGAALASLGGTPELVAAGLRLGGHRGRVCCEGACPVAEFLRAVFPATSPVVTGTDALLLDQHGNTVLAKAALPRAVRHFVDRFDLGDQFADLVLSGGAA